jgi:hypothetical protein
MNLVELDRALRQLRLSGMAAVLETRLRHAQTEKLTPIDLVSMLVSDELLRRQDRLLERRHKQARFRDPDRSLDTFDFDFNQKMNRALLYELATGRFVAQREDALFRAKRDGKEPPGPGYQPRRDPPRVPGHLSRGAHATRGSRGRHARWPARSISRTSPPCRC